MTAPSHRGNGCDELARIYRFRQMDAEPCPQGFGSILGSGISRQRGSRQAPSRGIIRVADFSDELEAVHVWHTEIGNQHVRNVRCQCLQSLFSGKCSAHVRTSRFENVLQHRQRIRVIVHGQHSHSGEFYGESIRHYDFTWLRTVAPGRGTAPHMDIVFMGRGTTDLYTTWTPLGDIPLEQGGLMILEHSHQHERLNNGYGRKDVDKYCVNHVGEGYTKMGGGGNIAPGGWLSKNPVKLRQNLGGRWLTADFRASDMLVFSMFTVHTSLDNHSDRIRISSDTRYQLASEPVDERWVGEHPPAHGPSIKQGMIC